MPSGCHHLTYGERCQIYALRKSGRSNGAIAAQLGRSPSSISRDPAQRRRPRLPPQAGAGQGLGAAQRRLVRCREDDPGAVADGGGQACGGLEPGPDRRPLPQGGHPHGGPGVDMPIRPRRQEGRAPFGPGPHPGPRGHLRASGDRGGEGAGRRPGGGHDRRQGPRRRAGGPGVELHASSEGWQEDGCRGGRRAARAAAAARLPGPHDHRGQRQGVRGPRLGGAGARGPGSSSRRRAIPGSGA